MKLISIRSSIELPILLKRFCPVIPLILLLSLQGCALLKKAPVVSSPVPLVPEEKIERNDFFVSKEDSVIGDLAFMRLGKGDTLPDIARHFSLGINEIGTANQGIDTWVPEAGRRILLPMSHILPDSPRKGIVVNLAAMRLFQFKGDGASGAVSTYPLGIGSAERPSPTGQMYVQAKTVRPTWHVPASIAADHRKKGDPLPPKVPPGPDNPLGEYALYLSKSTYLIHGTNKPYSIGLNATNGCMRLYPEDVKKLYENTPVNTPVRIVNQPHLVGQRNGVVYVEVHLPSKECSTVELEQIRAKLRIAEKRSGRSLDWQKVEQALAEGRGIPVSVSEADQATGKGAADPVEVKHPDKLYGKPEIPELKMDGWYVLAAETRDNVDAARLSAIINHQGPPIPARVVPRQNGYRVVSGPFNDVNEAKDAIKRLRFDLDIEGVLIEPPKIRQ